MTTRVFRYGLLAPVENEALVRAQMRAAHRHRNALVEIERGRRDALRDAEASAGLRDAELTYEAADARHAAATRAAKDERKRTGSRKLSEPVAAELADAKQAHRDARRHFAEVRRAVLESGRLDTRRAEINDLAGTLRRDARAICGAYWGTYLLVEAAAEASFAEPLWDGAEPHDPRFVRWTGEGAIGVQFQGGVTPAEILGADDTRAQILPRAERTTPGHAGQCRAEGSRRAGRLRLLRVRVGSEGPGNRVPVWASFPMVMHRDLPADARIKGLRVRVRTIGAREEWSAEFTVETATECRPRVTTGGSVAVNLGWRALDDGGLRVATWRATDGAAGALTWTAREVEHARVAPGLRSVRDGRFERVRAAFVAYLDGTPDAPTWLREAGRTAAQWRSVDRLAALVRRWCADVRVTRADVEAWQEPPVEAWTPRDFAVWRYDDAHLAAWQAEDAQRVLRHRKDRYRVFAADLAARHAVLVLARVNYRDLAERPAVGDDTTHIDAASANRHRVAVSELRQALREAFLARGGRVLEYAPTYATQTCYVCGAVEPFDAARAIRHTCEACGSTWDQDDNHARNLLRAHDDCERSGDGADAGVARVEIRAEYKTSVRQTKRAEGKAKRRKEDRS